jgi:hypothetical protein
MKKLGAWLVIGFIVSFVISASWDNGGKEMLIALSTIVGGVCLGWCIKTIIDVN